MTLAKLQLAVCEAASNYRFGKYNDDFAKLNGGMEALEKDLLEATCKWEQRVSELAKQRKSPSIRQPIPKLS